MVSKKNPATAAAAKPEVVKFEFFAPDAKNVAVAGSFGAWEEAPITLKKSKTGTWSGAAELQPGRYEYRFLVDGRWENDQKAVECVANPFGTSNCVIKVGKA